jgi:hypothetical protein
VLSLPGPYSNFLTFYAGPSASSAESLSCIKMRFSMIEMKTFFHILLTTFSFADTGKSQGHMFLDKLKEEASVHSL